MAAAVRRRAPERISLDQARRIALAAQGFANARPSGPVEGRHVRRVIDRLGVLQIDSVNVLCRSHYLPLFARLGPYPLPLLDRMAWGGRRRDLFEYWAHNASLVSLRMFRLLRWRMQAAGGHTWGSNLDPDLLLPWAVIEGMTRIAEQQPGLVDEVLACVTERGPVTAAAVSPKGQRHRGPEEEGGQMWNWHDSKIALEWLFCCGKVAIAARQPTFERVYDLTARVIPAAALAAPSPNREDAQRELVRIAARALGIATARELCGSPSGYFVLPRSHWKVRVGELVEAGELIPVSVDGLAEQLYLWPQARLPRRVQARALLSPFDSLIWDRGRIFRLFDFHYRIGIYTPAAKRIHGYYVLPFLLGERLVARVDLKADRKESVLLVQAAHTELDVREAEVAAELADELRLMASWLELDHVRVSGRGYLGPALSRAVRGLSAPAKQRSTALGGSGR
jgi:uncharacterized protein